MTAERERCGAVGRVDRGRAWRLVAAALACAAALPAHDPGLSRLQVRLQPERVEVEFGFAAADFVAGPGRVLDADGDGSLAPAELARAASIDAAAWLEVNFDGVPVAWQTLRARAQTNGDVLVDLVGSRPPGDQVAVAVPSLASLPHGHRQFVEVCERGHRVGQALLSPAQRTLGLRAQAGEAPAPELLAFVTLGVEHVVGGLDHLAFLLGLLLAVATWRQAALVVTTFTVAHSLTLVAAALGWIALPSTLVECAIAASVVLVGAENLWRRGARARPGLAFAFGLVHGLGFAACLADLDTVRGLQLITTVFGFNAGVELGQLGLVALLLPPWLAWRRRGAPTRGTTVVRLLSVAVCASGVVWLVERLP
ncbi:MAG: HupE/UreJ family protein [Planctomycetota bacterium]